VKIPAAFLLLALAAPVPALAQDVTEPATGVRFAARADDMSLLGVGLRTRTMFKVKVYAIGLYVADSALSGPLAAHKGKTAAPAFYRDLVEGDFPKQVVLKFVRDLGQETIQEAMRSALAGANKSRVDAFVSYFPVIKSGQECLLRWAPGGTLETTIAGQAKPPIADKAFAAALFSVWLGPRPLQEDIKRGLASRAPELIQ
jgi:hypothetical protein